MRIALRFYGENYLDVLWYKNCGDGEVKKIVFSYTLYLSSVILYKSIEINSFIYT